LVLEVSRKIRLRLQEASGHDFSRAARLAKEMLGFSPCGFIDQSPTGVADPLRIKL
jgi:hypothetical protein